MRAPVTPSDRHSVLRAVGEWVRREVAIDEILDRLVDAVAKEMDAERVTIYLVDPAAGEIFSKAARLPELKEIRLKIGQGVAGSVAADGGVVNLPAPSADPRLNREIDRVTGFETRSMLCGAVKDRAGRILGVIQVLNKRDGGFGPTDESLIEALGAQIGTVLESTSLYGELRAPALPGSKPVAYHYNRIVGESPAMGKVYARLVKAAATDATVLITGETGTGKGLLARAVHFNGARAERPFVSVDCAAIPETLLESELFGHERGAFTGADRRAAGKFEIADGGTVFLDEIGDLPPALQGKLLRVVQERAFERVGGTETCKVDVRIVAATHRDLQREVEKGRFREDLYYRLRVVSIEMPPLRERGRDDLLRLIRHFLVEFARRHRKEIAGIEPDALERLVAHRWPGNIRELENCLEGAVVLAEGPTLRATDLPLATRTPAPGADLANLTWDEMERRYLERVLEATGGNRAEAARRMGIGRNTLLRALKRHRL